MALIPSSSFNLMAGASPESAGKQDASMEFIRQYYTLTPNIRKDLLDIWGCDFLHTLISNKSYQVHNPADFFAICRILAREQSTAALNAWISISRGSDTADIQYTDDGAIEVTLSRLFGDTTKFIKTLVIEGIRRPASPLQLCNIKKNESLFLEDANIARAFSQAETFSQESAITDPESSAPHLKASPQSAPSRNGSFNFSQDIQASNDGGIAALGGALSRTSSIATIRADDEANPLERSFIQGGSISRTPTLLSVGSAREGWGDHSQDNDRRPWAARSQSDEEVAPQRTLESFGPLLSFEESLASHLVTAPVKSQSSQHEQEGPDGLARLTPAFLAGINAQNTQDYLDNWFSINGIPQE